MYNPHMSQSHLFPKLFAAASLLALAACAAPNWTTTDQQAFTIRAACERQHNNGVIATALATERCANGTIHRLYADAHYPQMDVLDHAGNTAPYRVMAACPRYSLESTLCN